MGVPVNLQAEWARLLLGSLAAAGVRDVVISPGSRSTPFVLAAIAQPDLRCHDAIDERSAAFFALGLARSGDAPPLLLCTSGTAGAHYLPAVIEAAHARLPLVLLTADRPFELQGCAAPQTIDQIKLFGDYARAFVELGLPDESEGALRALVRASAQAVHTARWPEPGAVHLNARARKPLEPPAPDALGPAERALAARIDALLARPPARAHRPRLAPDPAALDELVADCARSRRGLIVAGPAGTAQAVSRVAVHALAAHTRFPLLAEGASQLRFRATGRNAHEANAAPPVVDAFDTLLRVRGFRESAPPDLILQLGAPPTSAAFEQYLAAHPGVPRWVLAPHGWNDPRGDARALLVADVGDAARALTERLSPQVDEEQERWAARWRAASATAWREKAALLEAEPDLGEGQVVHATLRSLPRGGLLAVGNSLAIRALDTFGPPDAAVCEVLSQRGANGIDGLVSGAAGAAAGSGRPVTLLLGDVSLLHDVGGLLMARRAAVPLVVVVVNNAGGRIFEQLPVASASAQAIEHFTTPHDLSFGPAAALFGCRYARARTRAELTAALAEAQASAGCTLVEAVVPPGGAAASMRMLVGRVAGALDAEGLA